MPTLPWGTTIEHDIPIYIQAMGASAVKNLPAFSTIVFQHISSKEVIETYVQEVSRLLRSGALFKFQVQGYTGCDTNPDDTWVGASYSDEEAIEMAERCGFEPRYRHGAGEQYFWLWFFKR